MTSRRQRRNTTLSRVKTTAIAISIVASVALAFGSGDLVFIGSKSGTRAQTVTPDDKKIDPEVLKQIEALNREKQSRTDAQKKIDSRLLYRIKMERGEAIAENIPTLRSDLKVDDNGLIEVEITAHVNQKFLAALKRAGAEIISVLPRYRSVVARVPLMRIEELAARPEMIFIQPKIEPMTNQKEEPDIESPLFSNPEESNSRSRVQRRGARIAELLTSALPDGQLTGTVTSQADRTHRADTARTLTVADGTGLKIGVLSNGVNSLASRQATGDLPMGLTVLPGQAGSGDEGTAMLELVYDLAPGAQLFYATALPSSAQFAQNIKDLRTAGCDIIIDDVTYFSETPFQDGQAPAVISPTNAGIIIQAVNDVTIGSQAGALYFSSAGNSGNKNDNTSGVWEGDFVDGGSTGTPIPAGNNVHNFGGAVTQNVLLANGRVTLKWSDALGGSGNDYDLYVLNSAGTTVVAVSANIQSGTQDPYEDAGNCFAGERVVIVKKAGAANRFLHLNTNRGRLTVSTPGVVYGHNASLNSISVAATPSGPAQNNAAIGPFPGMHSGANVVETFSSDGPRRIFYFANGTQITPGNVSSTGGQLLPKPDITAADGSSTTTPGFIPFFGTSAAAPHAGALMALLKQASPGSTRTQLYNAMINSAIDIEAVGTDRDSGAGIFMPLRAMNAAGVSGPAFLEQGTVATSEYFGNGNGRIEPGEVANMNLPLLNIGLANATGVSATLTTSTTGIFVLNTLVPSALSYPDLPAAVGTGTTATPFRFGVDNTFPCGAPISFTQTVNYMGGSTPSQIFNFTVKTDAVVTINSTLDTTPPTAGTNYTAVTGTQTGRLNRNGIISTCASPKATPALQDVTVGRRFDAYTFTASASGCMTVTLATTLNDAGNSMYLAVYGNAGYIPTAIQTNYLADWGVTTGGLVTVGFNATAGEQFTLVVHEITLGGGIGANYTLSLAGPIVGACALAPTAAGVEITGRISKQDGTAIRNALVTLTSPEGEVYAGRSNAFGYYLIEGVPSGETYIANVSAKGFAFSSRVVSVHDSIHDLDFTAEP